MNGLLGGYGYLCEYEVERFQRDCRVHQILEGTNELIQLITSRALFVGGGGYLGITGLIFSVLLLVV